MQARAHYAGCFTALVVLLFVAHLSAPASSPSFDQSSRTQASRETDVEVSRLANQLKSPDEEARRDAALQLTQLMGDSAIAALVSALADSSPRVRAAVAAALGRREEQSAASLLASRLPAEKDKFVRKTIAYALGGSSGFERTAALVSALNDKDQEVRGAAAVSLGDHADAAAVTALTVALSDKSPFVRAQAAHALGVNKGAAMQAVPALINLLSKDSDEEVRRQAATALGQIGDRSALSALERARRDKDPYLVQAAIDAIRTVEGR
jgi:HEAT repeat protein